MSKYDKMIQQNAEQAAVERTKLKAAVSGACELAEDAQKTAEVYANAEKHLDEIDNDFRNATSLDSKDVAFLFFATALQCVRQYCLTSFSERLDDQAAAKAIKGHETGHSNRKRGEWYLPSFEEILINPVPYDAIRQNMGSKGALSGGGKLGHRLVLGHDPVLGWIFGTANIGTSTLTRWDGFSYHIKSRRWDGVRFDTISIPVDTLLMLKTALNRFFLCGIDGIVALCAALYREWDHLRTDVNSKNSLPFPVISTFSPELANTFANYGIDQCNINTVMKQVTYAEAINVIVGILHGMYRFYSSSDEEKTSRGISQSLFYEHQAGALDVLELSKVKTRKILLYSNVIASASNVIAVATMANTDPTKLRCFDLGGLAVTLYRLVTDTRFISSIKAEFLEKEWCDLVIGDDYSFANGVIENE